MRQEEEVRTVRIPIPSADAGLSRRVRVETPGNAPLRKPVPADDPLVLPEPAGDDASTANGRTPVSITLRLSGRPWPVRLSVADRQARLSELVPVARWMADRVMQHSIRWACDSGQPVSCRKGCAACCRYLVPLSAPEAAWLAGEIDALPSWVRRHVQQDLAAVARRIIQAGPPTLPQPSSAGPAVQATTPAGAAGEWYSRLKITCPLLRGDCCALYSRRPLACREHLVTSSPEACKGLAPGRGDLLQTPLSVLTALAALAAELEQAPLEAVIFPLVLAWREVNADRDRRTWPAVRLVERFLALLAAQGEPASKHQSAA
jgi:Fe-S-cluster containining protein